MTASILSSEKKKLRKVARTSLFVGSLLMLGKFFAYQQTGSVAIFSDALESIVNVVAAGLTLFVIYYASQPVDKDHPYGHGKVEYFSEAFEGGLISFAALMIVADAAMKLVSGVTVKNLEIGILITTIAGICNWFLALYILSAAKKENSIALKASGKHLLFDVWTSAGLVVGLLLVKYSGWIYFDPILGLMVGGGLAITGFKLVRESVSGLMDEEDIGVLKRLASLFTKYAEHGIIQVHHVKVIRSGSYHHIDAHLVVPENWTIDTVHDNVLSFEKSVLRDYGYSGELNYHLDPCRKAYCEVCPLEDCPIRVSEFKQRMPVKLEHLRDKNEPEQFRS